MTDLLLELIKCINVNADNYNISERNKYLEVNLISQKNLVCQFEDIVVALSKFPGRDRVEISFYSLLEHTLVINDTSNNLEEFNDFFSDISDEDEIDVEIVIKKKIIDRILSIYNYEKFCEYILSLELVDVVKCIEEDIQDCEQLILEVYDKNVFWATKTMVARSVDDENKVELFGRKRRIKECRKNNNVFWDGNILPLPDDFHFVVGGSKNPLKDIFEKIETMLSTIYIADSARIIKDKNIIYCELIGQRMNDYEIALSTLIHNPVLYNIYSWVYTEGNIVDKVIIVRNLLSMHCRYILITDIDEKTFGSIKVNYSLYQKENVENFIELKNNMITFISEAIDKSQMIIEKIVGDLEKNIVAFLSFILTVFITNIVNEKGVDNIFTKDITYLCYAVLGGSIFFMIISYIISELNIKRVERKYQIIKNNSSFIKGSKEYEEIFDDTQIENVKTEVTKHRRSLFICWGVILLIIFIVTESASQCAVSKTLFQYIEKNSIMK